MTIDEWSKNEITRLVKLNDILQADNRRLLNRVYELEQIELTISIKDLEVSVTRIEE